MNIPPIPHRSSWLPGIVLACTSLAPGCSSVIGSAYLREAWLDAVEHAAESRADARNEATREAATADGEATASTPADAASPVVDAADQSGDDAAGGRYATLEDAVADADRRLEPSGGLRTAARETLSSMLAAMPQRDWGVVVDEFTASLAAAAPSSRPASRAKDAPQPDQVAEATEREPTEGGPAPGAADGPDEPPLPAAPPAVPPTEGTEAAVTGSAVPPAAAPVPQPPAFVVQNACFATRVRAWGAVDRFESSRFFPGQEVIVYFELDQLAASESAEGHTTRVDTSLRLVAADGRRLHEWTFEPLEETCRTRRRDYFARYVLTLPESAAAGQCRLEISATDAVAGRTAQATLPLELLAR